MSDEEHIDDIASQPTEQPPAIAGQLVGWKVSIRQLGYEAEFIPLVWAHEAIEEYCRRHELSRASIPYSPEIEPVHE